MNKLKEIEEFKIISECFNYISVSGENEKQNDRSVARLCVEKLIDIQCKNGIILSSPARVGWKITGECNSSCKHCWAQLTNEKHSYDELFTVAEQLVKMKVLAVTISGGEPFLCNDFFALLKYLKSNNIIVEILTNGTLINCAVAQELSKIINRKSDIVQVSLDACDGDTYKMQRGKDQFIEAILGIKNLVNQQIITRVNFVATNLNQDYLYDTYKLISELGVDVFSITSVFPFRKGKSFYRNIDNNNYYRQIYYCLNDRKKSNTELRIHTNQYFMFLLDKYYERLIHRHILTAFPSSLYIQEGSSIINIDAHGEVLPGPQWDTNFSAGNVYKKNLSNIWNEGENWNELRLGRHLDNTKCATCRVFPFCQGGEPKLAYDKYGTINEPDGTCLIL